MANKTNCMINGKPYYRLKKVIGHKINAAGNEVPIVKQFYGENKKAAEIKYMEFMAKREQGLDSKRQYFGVVAQRWIYQFFINDDRLKDRTKDLYINAWNKYIKPQEFYSLPLDQVTASTIQTAYNESGAPASSLAAVNKLMRRFYKYLDREGFARDITGSLVLPKREKGPASAGHIIVWSDEEAQAILNSFDKAQQGFRLQFLIILAYHTGCRIGELLALTYNDFTPEGLRISKQVTEKPTFSQADKTEYALGVDTLKTSSSYRTIPINKAVVEGLERHKAWQKSDMMKHAYRTNYLFTTNSGGFYYRRSITHALERYYKRIGVEPKEFHTYRRTFGTNLCRAQVPIQVASDLLGHSDINVTAKYYVGVSMDEKQKAVDLLAAVPAKN